MVTEREIDEKYPIPADVESSYQDGISAYNNDEYEKSLLIFLDILKKYPENPKILNAVAQTYRLQRDFKQAEECFLRAITAAPDYVYAYNNLSLMFCEMGEHEKAAYYARLSIGLLKSSPIPWNTLGIYYIAIGEVRRGLEHIKAAYGYDPNYTKAAYNIACCYSLLGDKEKALEYLAIGVDTTRRLKLAEEDPELDKIRELPKFKEILNAAREKLDSVGDNER